MPFVHNMPEILIVQLVCFISSVKSTGSENSQEAWIIATLLVKKHKHKSSKVEYSPNRYYLPSWYYPQTHEKER